MSLSNSRMALVVRQAHHKQRLFYKLFILNFGKNMSSFLPTDKFRKTVVIPVSIKNRKFARNARYNSDLFSCTRILYIR